MFDVDGVLVDTTASYTEAVIRAVQWLLVYDAGVTDDGPAVDRETIRVWREAGGWNNDWDLTAALYRWLLAAHGRSTKALRRSAEPAERAANSILEDLATPRAPRTWEEIRGIFDELYNGSAVSVARHGVRARVHVARGLREDETVLLTPELIERLRALGFKKFGVVTGRSDDDWGQIASRIPLPPDTVVSTDAHGKKPDPLPLKRVLDNLGAKGFVAVGDTVDDARMVLGYLPLKGSAPGEAVVRCDAAHEAAYRALGVTRFVRHIDELPSLLGRVVS